MGKLKPLYISALATARICFKKRSPRQQLSKRSTFLRIIFLPGLLCALLGTLYLHHSYIKASRLELTPFLKSTAGWVSDARLLGHHTTDERLSVGLLLKTSNATEQRQLLARLYDKKDPQFHQWLTPEEFEKRFAPSAQERETALHFLQQAGLTLEASPDPKLLLATGTVHQIEAALHTTINDYQNHDGKRYFSNAANVLLPHDLTESVQGVFGLSNFTGFAPHYRLNKLQAQKPAGEAPYGGGPSGTGLTPSQIAGIYHIDPVYTELKSQGQGVTMAIYELSNYASSDIHTYTEQYALPKVPIEDRLVLGGTHDHSAAIEVELDVELALATAPQLKKVLVYQAANTELGAMTEYMQIARDNEADVISSSWGIPCEMGVTSQIAQAENQIFLQMAMQGQSFFVASGDTGAFGCLGGAQSLPLPDALQVNDPNNQPYVTAVGGTSFVNNTGSISFDPAANPHPTYPGPTKEAAWGYGCTATSCPRGGSGGGVSRIWGEPGYAFDETGSPFPGLVQTKDNGYTNNFSQGGTYCNQPAYTLCRENPDVSLNSDPRTGYSVYCTDPEDPFCARYQSVAKGWLRVGGTSCAAPIWAGIAALADSYQHKRLGLFNYIVYPFASPAGYTSQFHDITLLDNGYYPAGAGYDMATGIGTPDVFQLIKAITLEEEEETALPE